MAMNAPAVSAIVIARNEAQRIERCLASLRWADELIVLDGESSDDTAAIATRCGARVVVHRFDDFARQRNRGIDAARGDWILQVDADEEVPAELEREIRATIGSVAAEAAYAIPRRNHVFGGWVRHGGQWPDWQTRLFRRGAGRYTGAVHERLLVEGTTGRLRTPLEHHSTATISEYLIKLRRYTQLEPEARDAAAPSFADLALRPAAVFSRAYFLRQGFRDGPRGFLVAGLAAFYTFAVALRRWESVYGRGRRAS